MTEIKINKKYYLGKDILDAILAHMDTVAALPAADVVEVVRCKDCVWYVKSEGVCTLVSSRGEPGVPIQCYCNHGVRRCKEGQR